MLVTHITPRPRPLPSLPAVDLAHTATAVDELPPRVRDTFQLDVRSPGLGDTGESTDDWYVAPSHGDTPYRMEYAGFIAALAAAQGLAGSGDLYGDSVAVVQDAKDGARYVVPLGMWNPADESELSLSDIGGVRWNSPSDHVLLEAVQGGAIEAVVLDRGTKWLNFTGHPVTLPST